MASRRYLVVALLSLSVVSLEMIWTRIFSAEFYYTFAFLVLSLAVMGIGIGALAVRLFPTVQRPGGLATSLSLTGLMALAGPPAVISLGVRFSIMFTEPLMIFKFVLMILILGSGFFFAGVALALLFRKYHDEMPRIYMADLIGAGLGVIIAILAMNLLGTEAATWTATLPVLIAALLVAGLGNRVLATIGIMAVFMLLITPGGRLEVERPERWPVLYKHWDAMAKVKVYDRGHGRGLNIDNVANSPVYPFDGNWDRPDSLKVQIGIPVDYLIGQFDSCVFLSLGAGGGGDVLQALQEGATEIHAVEVLPHINRMMIEGDPDGYIPQPPKEPDSTSDADSVPPIVDRIVTCAEYSGHIYSDPRVHVATEDARAYARRYENKFDVIYSLSSNTFSAIASGSFAMAENYLFTTEAFMDYWRALSDSGYLMMEHQFYMPRLVGSVMEAFERLGVEDYRSHFAVYDLPQMRRNALLISKRPLDDSLRYHALVDLTDENYESIHLLYPAPDSLKENTINRIVTEGWRSVQDSATVNISPTYDDRPFVAQMGLWRNFEFEKLKRVDFLGVFGFPLAQSIIVAISLICLIFAIPLTILPYFRKTEKLRAAPWLYFFMIGAGFMILEIILIQRYTLFVGPSVLSIATILCTLLLFSGIGSRFSKKVPDYLPFVAILGWLALELVLFGSIRGSLRELLLPSRLFVSALMVMPLGFFLGMPFPKAASRVGPLVDWGLAVNGVASVLGSVLIMLVAFSYGFQPALIIGGLLYLIAFVLFRMERAWTTR